MPNPKATGSQDTNRPGASSAVAHCDARPRSRPAALAIPSGSNRPAGRRSISGAQALAPARGLPPLISGRVIAPERLPDATCYNLDYSNSSIGCGYKLKSACGFLLGPSIALLGP